MASERRWSKIVPNIVANWLAPPPRLSQPPQKYVQPKPSQSATLGSAKWLEDSIKAGHIIFFNYSEFKFIKQIGKGGYGTVECAEWKNCDQEVALKSLNTEEPQFNETSLKEFVNELDLLRKVSFHPNINRFYGVTKDPASQKYIMVLQYANEGNLRDYLRTHKSTLEWSDKYRMCLEIAKGLRCLHQAKIIHKDLHSKNILVHNGRMMIADLGLSRRLDENSMTSKSANHSTPYGMAGYIDPQCFMTPGFKRNKKSDIYSLGVLMWEICSCRIPFGALLPCTGIPESFIYLYHRCLKENPEERPHIEEVIEKLECIPSQNITSSIPVRILNEDRMEIRESPPSISQFVHQTDVVSLPQSLFTSIDTSEVSLRVSGDAVSAANSLPSSDNSNITNQSFYDAYTTSLPEENTTSQSEPSAQAALLLDEITRLYIEHIKIGSNITKNKFERWIIDHKENLENILHYLILNKNVIQHWQVMVGKFFERGIGTEINKKESFEWFKTASDMDDVYGHYNVGYCYYRDYGMYEEAIKYFELAAEKGLVSKAKYMLGIMKNNGYGTDKDIFRAFELFKEAAEHGYVPAQYWLAVFYLEGTGTVKSETSALEWFRKCVDSGGYEDAEAVIAELCKH